MDLGSLSTPRPPAMVTSPCAAASNIFAPKSCIKVIFLAGHSLITLRKSWLCPKLEVVNSLATLQRRCTDWWLRNPSPKVNNVSYPLVIWGSYWTWQFIVSFPMKNGSFHSYVKLPDGFYPLKSHWIPLNHPKSVSISWKSPFWPITS